MRPPDRRDGRAPVRRLGGVDGRAPAQRHVAAAARGHRRVAPARRHLRRMARRVAVIGPRSTAHNDSGRRTVEGMHAWSVVLTTLSAVLLAFKASGIAE